MLLIEEVVGEIAVEASEAQAEPTTVFACRARVPAELASDGWASNFLGVEMGAQAAALFEALPRWRQESVREHSDAKVPEEPRIGYLVGMTAATFEGTALPADRTLWVEVSRAGGMPPLARYEIRVAADRGGPVLVSATISTYLIS